MTRSAIIMTGVLLALFFAGGCQSMPVQQRPFAEDGAEVLVYMEPFTQEAGRISFRLAGIAAVREDGAEFPLVLKFADLARRDVMRQRLLAHGRVPAGRYTGFLFRIASASLTTEDGNAALLAPDAPVKRDHLFRIGRKRPAIVSLTLRPEGSVLNGYQFSPALLITTPSRPLLDLIGYVSVESENAILVLDKLRKSITGIIETGNAPRGMAIDRVRNRVYAALSGDDAVEVIDSIENRSLARVRLLPGDRPQQVELASEGQVLLAVNTGSDTVSFIEANALTEIKRVTVGKRPRSMVIDRSGRRAYVFNTLSNSISVVDIANRAVIGTIATGPEPVWGQFNRQGDQLYVVHADHPYLHVVDPASFTLLRREFVGPGMRSLKVDTRNDLLYLGRKNDTALEVRDPMTFNVVEYIPAKGETVYQAIDDEHNDLWLVIAEKDLLMTVNLINTAETALIDIPGRPAWVTLSGER
ncbi:MAG: beta-propeller fold lactonase family protein [Nitrospirota bacterium]